MVPASLLEGKEIGSIAEGSQISTNACHERNIFFFRVAYILDCHYLLGLEIVHQKMVHVVVLLPRSMIVTILPPSKALKQSTRSVELSLHFTSSHLGGEGETADSHVENMQPRQTNLKVEGGR